MKQSKKKKTMPVRRGSSHIKNCMGDSQNLTTIDTKRILKDICKQPIII